VLEHVSHISGMMYFIKRNVLIFSRIFKNSWLTKQDSFPQYYNKSHQDKFFWFVYFISFAIKINPCQRIVPKN